MSEHEKNGTGRKPDFIAYQVQDTQDGKGIWNRVGAAWQHKDGQGFDVNLSSVPVNGRVTLREMREDRMQDYEGERQKNNPDRQRDMKRGRSWKR